MQKIRKRYVDLRRKLRREGKIEATENLPGAGADRVLIAKAIGITPRITPEEFQRLKALIESTFAEDAPLQ